MADQVTNLTALTWSALVIAAVWIFLCIAAITGIVLFMRFKIMFTCGYGWKDAGVLLRRRSKRALHTRLNAERPQPVRATVVQPDPSPEQLRTRRRAVLEYTERNGWMSEDARRELEELRTGPGYTEVIGTIRMPTAGHLPETITIEQVD